MNPREQVLRRLHWYLRPFQRSSNMYRGVYASFEEAKAAVGENPGYDSTVGQSLYRERLDLIFPEDYALLFWLQPLAAQLHRVFDFGGHIGLHYYAFKTKLSFPKDLEWKVSDVPAVTREGEAMAKSRKAPALKFTTGFDGVDGCDAFISSGALQYLEPNALASALKACRSPPRHVLLNKIPVLERPTFFTVQDTWVFKTAYTIFNRAELIKSLKQVGYSLVDSWENPGHHCLLLRDPEHSVEAFSGFYFRLDVQ